MVPHSWQEDKPVLARGGGPQSWVGAPSPGRGLPLSGWGTPVLPEAISHAVGSPPPPLPPARTGYPLITTVVPPNQDWGTSGKDMDTEVRNGPGTRD